MKNRKSSECFLQGRAKIVYQDADLLVVDKPAGLVSARPGDQTGRTLFHYVKQYVRETQRGRQIGPAAWVIHRLDRDVSGLIVFAKSERAFLSLKDQLKRRQIRRCYLAAVEGEMPVTPPQEWKWVDAFVQDQGQGKPVRVLRQPPTRGEGRAQVTPLRAVTYYRVLAAGRGRSLLAVRLETGRKHQIRAHLAAEGHPVVGDGLYGANQAKDTRACQLALHAWELTFSHPSTGQPMRYLSEPPREFLTWVNAAREVLASAEASIAGPKADAPPLPGPQPRGCKIEAGGWDKVADWYEKLISRRHSDYHEELILPGVMRLLAPHKGQLILDVACGEGLLCRHLAQLEVRCVGVDASAQLIDAARRQTSRASARRRPQFILGDARALGQLPALAGREGSFDSAACVLALMNIDPLEPVLQGVGRLLKQGGSFVAVVLHPAFRNPGQTSWQWGAADANQPGQAAGKHSAGLSGSASIQYRRVDAYLSSTHRAIVMNPGEVADGRPEVTTITWHRPIQNYVKAFAEAGLLLDALEEWPSHRRSEPGPKAAALDRARREIPMFLAMRGRKQA